ncbi:CLUMA_CG018507, isoform A [Clunio marinus]|uniref:CLUMA_CG018507, isoform A n=1 Tax=Clunio marinus TaxID=568069 RepID=A0A1J1IXN7_9DIPT|nr:CLUMA_CG018507, isoform A [Clunio marinus]
MGALKGKISQICEMYLEKHQVLRKSQDDLLLITSKNVGRMIPIRFYSESFSHKECKNVNLLTPSYTANKSNQNLYTKRDFIHSFFGAKKYLP